MARSAGLCSQRLIDQRPSVGHGHVFGYLLTIRAKQDAHAVAHDDIQRRSQPPGFVLLGDDAVIQRNPRRSGCLTVAQHDLLQRFGLAGSVQHQHQTHGGLATLQVSDLFDHPLVALTHAYGIDNHPLLALQAPYQLVDGLLDIQRIHGSIQQSRVDAQLLVSTNPEAVGGHQRHRACAVAHHKTSRQLGRRGRLANPGRAYQGHNAGLVEKCVFLTEHAQPRHELTTQPGHQGLAGGR